MLQDNARTLRKNMTAEERKLWYLFLKTLPCTVHRQKVIGKYIVDFYCASAKLVIEVDGSQHFRETGKEKDQERDRFLLSQGLKVLRYANSQINGEFAAVCEDILQHITSSVTFGDSFPSRGSQETCLPPPGEGVSPQADG